MEDLVKKALAGKATSVDFRLLRWDKLELIEEDEYGEGDGYILMHSILKDPTTGKTYALNWGFDSSGWGEHDFEDAYFYEVVPKQVITTKWVALEEENGGKDNNL